MAAVRIEVEHGFAHIIAQWPFLNAWWKMRVFQSPTSQYFNCAPPALEEYFHD
ncbi:hypothetical protein GGX14DRAFT_580320 [Mycena pura]|uniref:Uncharacterized protein n=1 Tax=Mycena pura TaxID=153505 RepID=A0AAD6UTA8_9AGAR|nr:hypothetical protein GGX14DRAFT_580320 [Mycena pura]